VGGTPRHDANLTRDSSYYLLMGLCCHHIQTMVRRPKTATNCPPPPPPLSGLCSIPSGTAFNGAPIYGCGE
jgi:hypothetical protein